MPAARRTLARFLARAGVATRTEARELVVSGRVAVNGRAVKDPDTWIEPDRDLVALDGQVVRGAPLRRLFAYNKPRGVLVTEKDPEGRRIFLDDLPDWVLAARPHAIGRLDRASAGLLLLTNDTTLADKLLAPESHVEKEYRVKLRPGPSDDDLDRWRRGIDIGDATPTAPAEVTLERRSAKSAVVRVILTEGRNRQIRRMARAIGREVEWLVRVRIGRFELGDLEPGQVRELDADAVERSIVG